MKVEPYPYTARAWWGEAVVAESDACLLVETPGEPVVLYFPAVGTSTCWQLDGTGRRDAVCDGTGGPAGAGRPRRFDTEREGVRVEVLDGLPGDDGPRHHREGAFPPGVTPAT